MEATKYQYSLKFSLGTIALMLILMFLLLSNVIQANRTITWIIFGVFSSGLIFLLSLLIVKRLIPAIKGDIALELDEHGISDYIRDASIAWDDIDEINLVRGRSASMMRITLKWESEYGTEMSIPLRWIKGKDQDIYNNAIKYFQSAGVNQIE